VDGSGIAVSITAKSSPPRLRDLLLPPVIEPGRAGAGVCGHVLRVFERTPVLQKVRDAGRAESVISDRRGDTGTDGVLADHAPSVFLSHWMLGQHRRGVPRTGAEQPALAIVGDAGRGACSISDNA
jgi:hypothetical protein